MPRMNLPPERASFVGREREQSLVERALGASRLVTILGPPGVGKTTLARRVGLRLVERASEEVWFVDATEAHAQSELVAAIASVTGAHLTAEDPRSRLAETLAALGPAAVILDNLEQVAAAAADLVPRLLDAAPALRILATSREALGADGEICFELAPLPPREATHLFLERARAAGHAHVAAASKQELSDLVATLDGLPLAIELAAARAGALSVRELRARLAQRPELLSENRLHRPARQSAMDRAIDASWELLSAEERSALSQCAVFRGGFTLATAESVLSVSDPLARIEALRAKSLLYVTPPDERNGELRFGLYETVRAFAARRREPNDGAEERHARHFANAFDTSTPTQRLALERANLLGAHAWALEHAPELAVHLLRSLERLMLHRGPLPDLLALAERTVARAPFAAGEVFRTRALTHRALGRLAEARQDLLRALDAGGSADARAAALAELADVHRSLGRHADASENLARAHELVPELTDAVVRGVVHRYTGALALDQSRYDDAIASLEKACDELRSAGDGLRLGPTLDVLGDVYSYKGDVEQALHLHRQALAVHRAAGNRRNEGVTLDHMSGFLCDAGRFEEALEHSDRALAIHAEIGNRFDVCHAHWNRAATLSDLGRYDEAAVACEAALVIARELGARRMQGVVRGWVGLLAWLRGRTEAARVALREARDLGKEIAVQRDELLFGCYLAALEIATGTPLAARSLEIRERAARSDDHVIRAMADLVTGFELAARGDTSEARALLARVHDASVHVGEIRCALQLLERALRAGGPELVAEKDGRWFRPPGGDLVDLTRRKQLRLMLRRLVDQRLAQPGEPVSLEALVEAAWPGERILPTAAATRAYTAVRRLRDMGLRDLLVTSGDGYFLDPQVRLRVDVTGTS
jgi:predicted ATPase